MDVEKLIGEDQPASAIWTLVGRPDLNPFYRAIESSTEEGGRPAFDPQLLISLWVYAYSQPAALDPIEQAPHNNSGHLRE